MQQIINHLSIPIQLLSYVREKKVTKPFLLFLHLKFTSPGKFRVSSSVLSEAYKEMDIRCSKTSKKYFNALLELGWVYYSPKNKYVYIKSFDRIRDELKLTKINAVQCAVTDLKRFNSFIAAALISDNLRSQTWASKRKKAKSNPASVNSDNAQLLAPSSHFGLSNKRIGNLLNCRQTRACILKSQAENAGYIETRECFYKVFTCKADPNLRRYLYNTYPNVCHKMRIVKSLPEMLSFKKSDTVAVMIQLHDSIKSNMHFSKRRRLSKVVD